MRVTKPKLNTIVKVRESDKAHSEGQGVMMNEFRNAALAVNVLRAPEGLRRDL